MTQTVTAFRPYRPRRKVQIDPLSLVITQMQGLIDTDPDPVDDSAVAFHGLVKQWHAMLQSALVDAVKHQ